MVRREDGQSLVEFALIIPVLLLLVVGIFDFGRVLYSQLKMESITQDSVRMAGLGEGDVAVRDYVLEQFDIGDDANLQVTISPTEATRKSGDYVTVKMSYPDSILGVLGDLAIPYTVSSSSTMRVE